MIVVAIFVAGASGALLRYVIDAAVQRRAKGAVGLGTFVVNISGTLLAGMVAGLFLAHASLPLDARLVASTGFIGAYTTFSTWMWESRILLKAHRSGSAMANLVGSSAVGLVAASAGLWLGMWT